jgi:hypothetical protein
MALFVIKDVHSSYPGYLYLNEPSEISTSGVRPLSPFGPIILVIVGFSKPPSLDQVKLPSMSILGTNVIPFSPWMP